MLHPLDPKSITNGAPRAMFVTDLDGTLLDGRGRISDRTQDMLRRLGQLGVTRVIATGRSPYSFHEAVAPDLPIDFAVLSSGVGILSWPSLTPLRTASLLRHEIDHIASVLVDLGLDFMVHHPFPDNHRFHYYRITTGNADFERRINLYAAHATPLAENLDGFDTGAQLIAVIDGSDAQRVVQRVQRRLPDFSTLRTTSPLDHISTWIEILPHRVDKASATAWLAERLSVERKHILGVGNDYNDLHLLAWAGTSRVVANAPAELKRRFRTTASNDEDGVVLAVEVWLEGLGIR